MIDWVSWRAFSLLVLKSIMLPDQFCHRRFLADYRSYRAQTSNPKSQKILKTPANGLRNRALLDLKERQRGLVSVS